MVSASPDVRLSTTIPHCHCLCTFYLLPLRPAHLYTFYLGEGGLRIFILFIFGKAVVSLLTVYPGCQKVLTFASAQPVPIIR